MKTTIGERLKECLAGPPKRTGKALAAACGVQPPSVSDWLNGETKTLEASNLLAAADFFGVRAKWLADGVGSKYEIGDTRGVYQIRHQQEKLTTELLELFSQLDADGKTEFMSYTRGFVAGRRPHPLGTALDVADKKSGVV